MLQGTARAEPIKLQLAAPPIAQPGDVVTFEGTITNTTGVTLTASDLFLNFSGYDPSVFAFTQLLGVSDFVLPNNTFPVCLSCSMRA